MALKILIEDTELRKELQSELVAMLKSMARSEAASIFERELDKATKAHAERLVESSWLRREYGDRVLKEVVAILVKENRSALTKSIENIAQDKEVFGNGVQEFVRTEVRIQVEDTLNGVRKQALDAIAKTTTTLAALTGTVPK